MRQMEQFVVKDGKELKMGFTTGSCAAAAAGAAAVALLSGTQVQEMVLDTPKGIRLYLPVIDLKKTQKGVSCGVIKDAGDDPDVTDGIMIRAEVYKTEKGYLVEGGEGVGRVTKHGLSCPTGSAAINPVPRKMICEQLEKAAASAGYSGGLCAVISACGGEEIAKKTFNPRLGIIGGISILGTSGIVEPMSERALIETIKLEIDRKAADGIKNLLICPGNYGRDFALREFGLQLDCGVKCSNFIGEALDYAVYKKMEHILLIGHAGKLSKLAAGIMNTHSRTADGRCEIFAAHAALAGAEQTLIQKIMNAVTTDEIDGLLLKAGLSQTVWRSVLDKIRFHIDYRTGKACMTQIVMFTDKGKTAVMTEGTSELIRRIREEQQ